MEQQRPFPSRPARLPPRRRRAVAISTAFLGGAAFLIASRQLVSLEGVAPAKSQSHSPTRALPSVVDAAGGGAAPRRSGDASADGVGGGPGSSNAKATADSSRRPTGKSEVQTDPDFPSVGTSEATASNSTGPRPTTTTDAEAVEHNVTFTSTGIVAGRNDIAHVSKLEGTEEGKGDKLKRGSIAERETVAKSKSLESDAAVVNRTLLPDCPIAVRNAVGLYRNSTGRRENRHEGRFSDVVLLTSSNVAYFDLLQNWECLASRLGLKWAVLAMDDGIYNLLGPGRAVPTNRSYRVARAETFRTRGFNKLSCNKLRMVYAVVERCDVDVVFSDCDNVFFHDPFRHDMGKLMLSGRYDYLYQVNDRNYDRPRRHYCLRKGQFVHEGNTGFYYLSRKSPALRDVFRAALRRCENRRLKIDDQAIFWEELSAARQGGSNGTRWRHCDAKEVDGVVESMADGGARSGLDGEERRNATEVVSGCCLDPYDYPFGNVEPPGPNQDMRTFHANYCRSKEARIDKLKKIRVDGLGWNEDQIDYSYLIASGKSPTAQAG